MEPVSRVIILYVIGLKTLYRVKTFGTEVAIKCGGCKC